MSKFWILIISMIFTAISCKSRQIKESTAYQFGTNNGLITYTFPNDKRPDTKNDLLELGFSNTADAVLVRIFSGSTNDYIELHLVDGNVVIVYNLGTVDHNIGELSVKVNDGGYHMVRFTRSGQNSTIQVDNLNIITKSPIGRQLTMFNTHSKVQIGGKKNFVENLIEKPFHGIIAGFVFNGLKILHMVVENDSHITVEGDVKPVMSINRAEILVDRNEKRDNENTFNKFTNITIDENNAQMDQPKSSADYEADDLIYSDGGSACFEADDEDNCRKGLEGSGDDLITPLYVPNTKPSTPMPTRPEWPEPTSHTIGETPIISKYPFLTTRGYNRPVNTIMPMYAITGPTRHPTIRPPLMPLGPHYIFTVPPLEIPNTFAKYTPKPTENVTKSNNDMTVMIIGIIAIGLIIVVIIVPIVNTFSKVKYRRVNKNIQFAPVSGSPPLLGSGLQQTHSTSGGTSQTSPTDHHKELLKMPKINDLNESYV